MIVVKELPNSDLVQLKNINREETVNILYHHKDGSLDQRKGEWSIPAWNTEQNHPHSVITKIEAMQADLENGALLGAYMDGQLAGLASIRYELDEETAQLLSLHVSKNYRRKGVASALYQELERMAVSSGAIKFYVSACPTGSAVGFYLSKGFYPTDDPHPVLFEEEPEDIHMIKFLGNMIEE